jgi:hypothetical protein
MPRIPRSATYEERAIALAQRLGITDTPPLPLTDPQWLTLWVGIGKALLRIEPPEPRTLQTLWADVGMYLAELSEPEFQWGPGRRLGSKSQKPRALMDAVDPATIRQRRSRERKRDRKLGGN